MDDTGTSAPPSSIRRPTGHVARAPRRRRPSKSAGAGNGSRRAAKACNDRRQRGRAQRAPAPAGWPRTRHAGRGAVGQARRSPVSPAMVSAELRCMGLAQPVPGCRHRGMRRARTSTEMRAHALGEVGKRLERDADDLPMQRRRQVERGQLGLFAGELRFLTSAAIDLRQRGQWFDDDPEAQGASERREHARLHCAATELRRFSSISSMAETTASKVRRVEAWRAL